MRTEVKEYLQPRKKNYIVLSKNEAQVLFDLVKTMQQLIFPDDERQISIGFLSDKKISIHLDLYFLDEDIYLKIEDEQENEALGKAFKG